MTIRLLFRHGIFLLGCVLALRAAASPGDAAWVTPGPAEGAFPLVTAPATAPLFVDAADWPGVIRASRDLQADIERVTGLKPALGSSPPKSIAQVVLIGTLGHSPLIDD